MSALPSIIMSNEQKTCMQCGAQFTIDEQDRQFYQKMQVPSPTWCPADRLRRRLIWTNEMNLYTRKCDMTGEDMLSMYPAGVNFPVYKSGNWYKDSWSALDYGRDVDFRRPFFEQWAELRDMVPHYSRLVIEQTLQNSDYINFCSYAKNCYLIFDSDNNEDCYYSYTLQQCKDVMDCRRVRECQLCYGCIDCRKCYNCRYVQDSQNCTDCYFVYSSNSLMNCFGCVNLYRKEYCWFNEQLTRTEYEKRLGVIDFGDRKQVESWAEKFEAHKKKFPRLDINGSNNQNSYGDYLLHCKNARDCFDSYGVEDGRYCIGTFLPIKDAYDTYQVGEDSSLIYESALVGFGCYNIKFSWGIFEGCSDIEYSQHCRASKNLFGCISVCKGEYCILNKQYTKADYEQIRAKLIAHMKETEEWGEYFPASLTPFAYNKSNADLELPLPKAEAIARGFRWYDEEREWKPATAIVPDNIKDVKDDILQALLADKGTDQNYKIIKQELDYYRAHRIPAPLNCFMERHKKRAAKRNPRVFHDRTCEKCGQAIKTTYAPESGYTVYCRECFLKEVT